MLNHIERQGNLDLNVVSKYSEIVKNLHKSENFVDMYHKTVLHLF